ncbi:hypothetical protein DPMN_091396 [Dreissena polymorpha]|uniref:Uncharacterized protein n=1 Tax=Dreissena polymorpha TaxID=45954 RepID=A0A9D4L205_DREPO|nr:hypothetical protein DPMN_091396 [Dreissena polymorpha]
MFPSQEAPGEPHSYPHRRQTVCVSVVRENIQCEGKLDGSPGDSRWRGQSTDDVIM